MRNLILCSIFALCAFASAGAQTPEPQTPAECLATVQNYPRRQAEAARIAGQKLNYRQYQADAQALAKKHAAKFTVESVRENELVALARLYVSAQQYELAGAAIKRRLASTALTTDERAEALAAGVDVALSVKDITDEVLKQAEALVAQLDALPGVAISRQLAAHGRIGGYYSYADMDAKNLEHHEKIVALINKSSAEEQKRLAMQKSSAYQSIAVVHANRGQADKAIDVLKTAAAELSGTPNAAQWLNQAIKRYSQIGQSAPAIKAAHWINAESVPRPVGSDASKELSFGGRVTLLQFTAHWCIPCRNSYPAIHKFHDKFAEQGLEVVFSTQLYGFFEKREGLKPEEELEADREYYAKHHGLPFKVAVEPRLIFTETGAPSAREDNEAKYFVGGIPQMVLIDKQGNVRMVMIGWDAANETRMT
ncbi:MAG TPA: TlpA disulfide reductase family protein, partial [Blastocatellia bacterium]|nr:TlpA disulfide reductase family protein [Blastocatellia bacterium]